MTFLQTKPLIKGIKWKGENKCSLGAVSFHLENHWQGRQKQFWRCCTFWQCFQFPYKTVDVKPWINHSENIPSRRTGLTLFFLWLVNLMALPYSQFPKQVLLPLKYLQEILYSLEIIRHALKTTTKVERWIIKKRLLHIRLDTAGKKTLVLFIVPVLDCDF